jgi:hypothetical protein
MHIYCTLKHNGKCSVLPVHNAAPRHANLRESEGTASAFLNPPVHGDECSGFKPQELHSQGKEPFIPTQQ